MYVCAHRMEVQISVLINVIGFFCLFSDHQTKVLTMIIKDKFCQMSSLKKTLG